MCIQYEGLGYSSLKEEILMKKQLFSIAMVLVLVVAMALPVLAASTDVDDIMNALQDLGVIPDNVLTDAQNWLTAYDQSNPPAGKRLSDYKTDLIPYISTAKTLLVQEGILTTADLAVWDKNTLDDIYKLDLWNCIVDACQLFSDDTYGNLRFTWDAGLERIEIHDDIRPVGNTLVTYFSRPEWIAANKPDPNPNDPGTGGDWVTISPQGEQPVDPGVNPIKQTGAAPLGSLIAVSVAVVGLLGVCAIGTRRKRT